MYRHTLSALESSVALSIDRRDAPRELREHL